MDVSTGRTWVLCINRNQAKIETVLMMRVFRIPKIFQRITMGFSKQFQPWSIFTMIQVQGMERPYSRLEASHVQTSGPQLVLQLWSLAQMKTIQLAEDSFNDAMGCRRRDVGANDCKIEMPNIAFKTGRHDAGVGLLRRTYCISEVRLDPEQAVLCTAQLP